MGSATSTTGEVRPYNQDDVETTSEANSTEMSADIEVTRARMGETVDAIQAKLSPQNVQNTTEQVIKQVKVAALEVAEQVTDRVKDNIRDATIGRVEKMADNVRETTRGASSSILETIKANPIPAAMVGIGVAWLLMNKSNAAPASSYGYYSGERNYRRQDDFRDYPDRQYGQDYQVSGQARRSPSEFASDVQDKAGQVASNVKDKAGEFVDRAQQGVEHFGSRVQDRTQRIASGSQSMMQDNPMMSGALAVALGLAVGFVLPETQRENELMGEARDKLINRAGEVAQDTVEKVQRVATEALHSAQDTVKQEAQNQGLSGNKA